MKKFFIFGFCCLLAFTTVAQNNVEEMRRYILRAKTAYNARNFTDALKEYEAARAIAPNYPEVYKAIGDVYEQLGGNEDLIEAINSYNTYLKLAPNAGDSREVLDKIYSLQYIQEKAAMQAKILKEVAGSWVAIDDVEVTNFDAETGNMSWVSDYVFNIEEVLQGGKSNRTYRITIQKDGCRNYRESIIEKTVTINMTEDNFLNFTFADAQVYVPNPAKYNTARIFGNAVGDATKKPLIGDLINTAVDAYQATDLPSNTQTAYTFMLNYDEGNLVGRVGVKQHYSDPNVQKVTKNEWNEITFVKQDEKFYVTLKNIVDNQVDTLILRGPRVFVNPLFAGRQEEKLSDKEVYTKMQMVDIDLAKQYKKVAKRGTTWRTLPWFGYYFGVGGGLALALVGNDKENTSMQVAGGSFIAIGVGCFIAGIIITADVASKRSDLIHQYNDQLIRRSNKPVSELRFGITSSGGIGLTLNF
jgi:tetratricopeptide (TPR) repeat protein